MLEVFIILTNKGSFNGTNFSKNIVHCCDVRTVRTINKTVSSYFTVSSNKIEIDFTTKDIYITSINSNCIYKIFFNELSII